MVENESGFHPTGDMVLVRPLEVEEVSRGGIVIAQTVVDREELAQCNGIVIAIGGTAHKSPRMEGVEPGMLVMFAKYAGWLDVGKDGRKYRLIRGDDVAGWREKPPSERPVAYLSATKAFDIA